MAKHVFVTGGVVSSLGKGITAASLGRLLKSRGLRVVIQKFDPYLNVDPGTMSPFQHGEVFVTDDGAETDLDLGHYERFIDESLTRDSNITSGLGLLQRHPQGTARATTWAAPCRSSPTSPTRSRSASAGSPAIRRSTWSSPRSAARWATSRACPSWRPSVSSARHRPEERHLHPRHPHPVHRASGELKTKPTQHSVNELREIGIQPDIIVCRSDRAISQDLKDKIALFTDVEPRAVVACVDAPDVYLVPLNLRDEGLDRLVIEKLGLQAGRAGPVRMERAGATRSSAKSGTVRIALVGKYVQLQDAYLSVVEALRHAGLHHGRDVEIVWVDAERPATGGDHRASWRSPTASWCPAASASAASRARSWPCAMPARTTSPSWASAWACRWP